MKNGQDGGSDRGGQGRQLSHGREDPQVENFILDWEFDLNEVCEKANLSGLDNISVWKYVNKDLCCMAGVVDTGLFVNMAKVAYFGTADGSVIEIDKRSEC